MLSKENYDRLDPNILYKLTPVRKDNEMYIGTTPITFWCKNWTFRVYKEGNGNATMYDTYWSNDSDHIHVTDENIDDFEIVFDYREVKEIRKETADEYNKEDVFCVSVDSGGMNYPKYFVRKDTKKSKELLIQKKKDEIKSLQNKLKWVKDELKRIEEGAY